ncbi:hypothetical protein BofuT4_P138930.1 [Botrytis cinerea T4]|uniref:Uncharacterized protein n=1 Tax=Botryotinia fuckeliana (strain T4) TaxID=999810 RepID=G2YMX1_BOTF4|nr:hypothetical protein BofuT4_P138930.1 [Botrytis cinerea T4]
MDPEDVGGSAATQYLGCGKWKSTSGQDKLSKRKLGTGVFVKVQNIMSNSTNLSPAYLAENRSSRLVISNSIFFGLAAINVLLRFVARKLKNISWGVDDYLIALALVRCFPESAPFQYQISSRAIDRVKNSPTTPLSKEDGKSENQALISAIRFG